MRSSDICETVGTQIEQVFFGEWKHEGYICGCSSEYINFVVDNREYVLVLHEVEDGYHFSEFLGVRDDDRT